MDTLTTHPYMIKHQSYGGIEVLRDWPSIVRPSSRLVGKQKRWADAVWKCMLLKSTLSCVLHRSNAFIKISKASEMTWVTP